MKKFVFLFFGFYYIQMFAQHKNIEATQTVDLMGTTFEITVVVVNKDIAEININEAIEEIKRIERLISVDYQNSEVFKINKYAGLRPVKVKEELFSLIERCRQISEFTNGAFDITYASLDKVWNFDNTMMDVPSAEEVRRSISKIGYDKIILNESERTVFLKEKGMKVSFDAIGKGYAVDKAKEFLVSRRVAGGAINADGDATTWGTKANGDKWMTAIKNPLKSDKKFLWLPIVESSIATSGDSSKYLAYNGKRYSCIIDPRTGYPSAAVKQVSIFAKSAALCDALATAVFILGKDEGLTLIDQLGGIDVILFDSDNEVHKSAGVQ